MNWRPWCSIWSQKRYSANLATVLTGVGAVAVYLLTVATDLTWSYFGADGGELITAAYTWGVPHPPGYPLYVVLGHAVGRLPWGIPAFRFNLFSVVCMAVAAAGVSGAAAHLIRGRGTLAAMGAGLTFAFSGLVWQQAVITEVYALNLACLSLALLTAIKGRPVATGILAGLAVVAHPTSILMVPLFAILIPHRGLPGFLTGFLPPLLLWLLPILWATGDSPVVWGDPRSLPGWLWLVGAEIYRPHLFGLPISDLPDRLIDQFLPLLWFQLGSGGWFIFWLSLRDKSIRPKAIPILLTVALFFLFAMGYDRQDAAVHLLPGLLLVAVLLAPALRQVNVLAVILPLVGLALNFSPIFEARRPAVRLAAETLLRDLPRNALVITDGQDETTFTLWYFHFVEDQRTDISLVDRHLFAFDWYRTRLGRLQGGLFPMDDPDINQLIAVQGRLRPICQVSLAPARHTCHLPP